MEKLTLSELKVRIKNAGSIREMRNLQRRLLRLERKREREYRLEMAADAECERRKRAEIDAELDRQEMWGLRNCY